MSEKTKCNQHGYVRPLYPTLKSTKYYWYCAKCGLAESNSRHKMGGTR